MDTGRHSAAWAAYSTWSAQRGLLPLPAAPGQVAAFVAELEARGGPFAGRQACRAIADVAAELGIPAPLGCPTGPVNAHSAIDYGRAATYAGISGYGGTKCGPVGCIDHLTRPAVRVKHWRPVAIGATGLTPTMPRVNLAQAEALLIGLVALNVAELRRGAPMPSPLIAAGRVRYDRADADERWLTWPELLAQGRGDCEDLAAAVAAERTVLGMPSRVRIIPSPSGGPWAHAVVQDVRTGRMLDPSITAGMGWNEA